MLIQDHELIVGHPCGKPRAGAFSPDTAWEWLEGELNTIGTRPQDPYFINEEDKTIMREQLFPFWKGKSVAEACEAKLREAGIWEFGAEACVSDLTYHMVSGGGDTSPGYDILLFTKGILGLKAEAEVFIAKLSSQPSLCSEDKEKEAFYQGAIEVCEGVLTYSRRLAEHARTLMGKETNPERKAELETIAQVNERVPAYPPQTFQEALQSIWTIQSLFLMEENQCSTSLGRLDQYVFPCFEKDMAEGKITQEQAFELVGCFIIKCSGIIWYTPEATATYFAGYMPFINMCVGGVKRDGSDGTNALTYLIMDTVEKVKMYQPSLACRIHNDSPQEYIEKVLDVIHAGAGMPACHFDDAHIRMMLRKGFSLEDARDYCLMGCVEPQKSGRIHQWTVGGFTQWPIAIEFVFNRGVLPSHATQQGIDTGPLEDIQTYEQFETAVKRQLDHIASMTAKGSVIIQEVVRDMAPTPYMSLFVDGCMEKGRDVLSGGAVLYEGPDTIFAGLATYADSMASVKKLVFDAKKYTLTELKKAQDANWQGYEAILKDCLDAPKYGNDIDYADTIAADIVDYTESIFNQYKSLYAKHIHGTLSQSFNTPLGAMIGATPDGRPAKAPLSDAMSPSQGADTKGPTAIIKSVSKINVEAMSLGMAHNFKLARNVLTSPQGRTGWSTLLRAASVLGNAQMQFNCVDKETLLAAQTAPKEHRDLIVRVAGYSAFFVELCKEVQDEIISRTTLE